MPNTTYRLPDSLGGHACEIVRAGTISDDPVVDVKFQLGEHHWPTLTIARSLLVAVEAPAPPTPPEPEGEFFVMDMPNGKMLPRILVQHTKLGWAFVGGNYDDLSKGTAGGPMPWEKFHARHPNGILTRLVPEYAEAAA